MTLRFTQGYLIDYYFYVDLILINLMRATFPAHLIRFDMITLISLTVR
jgi:hypothetical protein